MQIPAGVMAAGTPAAVKKQLDGGARRWVETAALEYQSMRERYVRSAQVVRQAPDGARRSL
jgi:carbonic anhydrase/acetyltransferase-like protein (isoleucine patch superfamily)